jgi:hypothetical protein
VSIMAGAPPDVFSGLGREEYNFQARHGTRWLGGPFPHSVFGPSGPRFPRGNV